MEAIRWNGKSSCTERVAKETFKEFQGQEYAVALSPHRNWDHLQEHCRDGGGQSNV